VDGEDGNIVRWYPGIDNSLSLDDGNRTAGIDMYNVPPVLTDTVRLEPGKLQQHRRRHRHGHGVKTITTTIANGLAKSVDDKVALHHSSDDTEQRRIKQPLQPESLTFFDFAKTAESDVRPQSVVCSRRRLIVDAVDIGWNERVIFPRQFQADYCAGPCPFPWSKVQLFSTLFTAVK